MRFPYHPLFSLKSPRISSSIAFVPSLSSISNNFFSSFTNFSISCISNSASCLSPTVKPIDGSVFFP